LRGRRVDFNPKFIILTKLIEKFVGVKWLMFLKFGKGTRLTGGIEFGVYVVSVGELSMLMFVLLLLGGSLGNSGCGGGEK